MGAGHILAGLLIISIQHYMDNFITERRICSMSWKMVLSWRVGAKGRRIMMKEICRNTLGIGLVVLLMAGICSISPAQPDGGPEVEPSRDVGPQCMLGMGPQCQIMPAQNEGFPMGVPLEVLYSGHGLAWKGNESHRLRLKVEAIMPMSPGQIRDLLSSNKSLEEIRDDIMSRGKETEKRAFRGSMILDRSIYPLANIAVDSSESGSRITADLVDISRPPSDNPSALGSISVNINTSEGKTNGEGELNIQEEGRQEIYSLILDMDPGRRRQTRESGMVP
jgi:hypothetical protein